MPRDIEPAAEFVDHDRLVKEAERREHGITADARVRMLDRERGFFIVDHTQCQEQRLNEFQSAAEMIQLVDLRQRRER